MSQTKSICGTILIAENPKKLADFYSSVLGFTFEKEDHGNLDIHYGTDIGEVHFGIHPPNNFKVKSSALASSTVIAFNVESIDATMVKIREHQCEEVVALHDEGFGSTATFRDPEGNLFEVVELKYEFNSQS